jgi:hypothetical protein
MPNIVYLTLPQLMFVKLLVLLISNVLVSFKVLRCCRSLHQIAVKRVKKGKKVKI